MQCPRESGGDRPGRRKNLRQAPGPPQIGYGGSGRRRGSKIAEARAAERRLSAGAEGPGSGYPEFDADKPGRGEA